MKRRLRLPSPGTVIACLALAVALAGTGYAATALPRNSVGTAQLKANAVNSKKVKNGSLLRADFASGQLPAGPAGPAGSAGPAGPTGSAGPAGPAGTTGQSALVSYGTSGLALSAPPSAPALIPGLTQTITVPASSVVYVSTDGGASTSSATADVFSTVDVVLMIDGVLRPSAAYRRLVINNTGSVTNQFEYWSFADTVTLTPGSHTIQVFASFVLGQPATVSGDSTTVLQGQLSVLILKT